MRLCALAASAWLALAATPADAAPAARLVSLPVPVGAAAHQMLVLHVQLGAVHRGITVLVERPDGSLAGTISPYAIVPGNEAGTYTVPLKPEDVKNGHVALRLAIALSGDNTRAPTLDEVPAASLAYVAVSR